MFFKIIITLILTNHFFTLKSFVLNDEIVLNSSKKSEQDINSKLVNAYIDFADILQENEVKINKTIDQKFDQVDNKLNKLGKLTINFFGF